MNPAWLCLYSTVYSDGWRVTNVWDSEQLVSEKSHILSRLGKNVLSDKPHREIDSVSSTCITIYTSAIANKLDIQPGVFVSVPSLHLEIHHGCRRHPTTFTCID